MYKLDIVIYSFRRAHFVVVCHKNKKLIYKEKPGYKKINKKSVRKTPNGFLN